MPDVNPDNNSYSGLSVPQGTTASTVIKAYLDAIGGADKLKNVRDLQTSAIGNIQGAEVQLVTRYKMPDKYFQEAIIPSYNNLAVSHITLNGDSVKARQVNREVALDEAGKKIIRLKSRPFPELDYERISQNINLQPILRVVNGELAYELDINIGTEMHIHNYYSQKTGLKLKQTIEGANDLSVEFGNYEGINGGIKIPFSIKIALVGQQVDFKVKETSVNSNPSNESFK